MPADACSLAAALARLGAELCSGGTFNAAVATPASLDQARHAAAGVVLAIPAGGYGYRMREPAPGEAAPLQKALLPLPNGQSLLGRILEEYAASGVRRAVVLANHDAAAVSHHLEETGWSARMPHLAVSLDPLPAGSGRSGALAHAVAAGLIPAGSTVVVHNADCQVAGYPGPLPLELLAAHRLGAEHGALATVAAVPSTPYPYTALQVREGRVLAAEPTPAVPLPAHAGITVLSSAALAEVCLSTGPEKGNFERTLFPRWAAAGRLAALVLRGGLWIAVDDRSAYRRLCAALEQSPGAAECSIPPGGRRASPA